MIQNVTVCFVIFVEKMRQQVLRESKEPLHKLSLSYYNKFIKTIYQFRT